MEADPILTELHREIAALKERVTALEAQAASVGAVTCSSLTVVDAQNKAVATIDDKGKLECRRLLIGPSGPGTCLVFDSTEGEMFIQTMDTEGRLQVKLVALNENGLGRVTLRPPISLNAKSFVRFTPGAGGARIELAGPNGKTLCDGNVSSGGSTWLFKSRDPCKGQVRLGVDGNGNGEIELTDANGKVSAKLP